MHNKSTGLWIHRLFKQSGALITVPQSKTYFAHRYHDEHIALEQNPFSTLFSHAGKNQPSHDHDADDLQRFFVHESALTKSNPVTVEAVQTCASNKPPAPNNKLNLSKVTNLNTQFTVLNCYDETSDTKTFRLGKLNGQPIDYLPGQYMSLAIVISGQEHKRFYSLASSPSHQGIIDITVKRASNGGLVSNWLNDHLKIGDTLNLKGPFGKFSCVNLPSNKILFLAAGCGIVPIMSMLRWLADTEAPVDIKLLLSFRTPEDIIYRDELNLITARHKNISLSITLTSDQNDHQWFGLTGRINEKLLNERIPDLPERTVYLCGPEAFMAACKQHLLNLNLPAEKLFRECFSVNSPITRMRNSELVRSSRNKSGTFQITFAKSGKTITTHEQLTLLELAEKSGIRMNHECRNGYCGECMVKCTEGKVEMTDQAEITVIDRTKGWIYACCAYPASNVVLDI